MTWKLISKKNTFVQKRLPVKAKNNRKKLPVIELILCDILLVQQGNQNIANTAMEFRI